ncbi:hypothetical protein ACIP9H_33885 [Streptomyces sp. NPDC088732]|uniref:hypothetical protein n=1 Tax=Streptomyces sp. NPDC088732 TaxID=3365879 RepID=UPI00380E15C0
MVRITAAEYKALLARRSGATASRPAAAVKPKKARVQAHPGLPSVPEPPDVEQLLVGLAGVGRTWTLLMPYRVELLTSNQRLHHMAVHRLRSALREDAAKVATAMRLPRLERAAVFYVLHPRPVNRKRDPGNWAPTAKAYVDGLVTDGKLLPDDSHEHLLGPNPVMGSPVTTGYARMTMVIAELT